MPLPALISSLRRRYGPPAPPLTTDPFELVLLENIAYLVDDHRRGQVWQAFLDLVGRPPHPRAILAIDPKALESAIRAGGMQPAARAEKLRRAARICLDLPKADLAAAIAGPLPAARRILKRFPGIGDPGADKVLLLTRTSPIFALDSNGLRALVRLGYGQDCASYVASYRSVQAAVAPELRTDFDWLIAAHTLLRTHGQTLCTRKDPRCPACPLAATCPSADTAGPAALASTTSRPGRSHPPDPPPRAAPRRRPS